MKTHHRETAQSYSMSHFANQREKADYYKEETIRLKVSTIEARGQ